MFSLKTPYRLLCGCPVAITNTNLAITRVAHAESMQVGPQLHDFNASLSATQSVIGHRLTSYQWRHAIARLNSPRC